jgi:hypothetical protein
MNVGLVALVVQTAAVWFMVGFIWVMQVLHYPLFDRVGRDAFPRYETDHNRLFSLLVGPGIAVTLITTAVLLALRPAPLPGLAVVLEVLLLVVIIASTAIWQAPQHGKLAKGFDQQAYEILVQTNWIRTAAWSIFGLLDLWMIWNVIGSA